LRTTKPRPIFQSSFILRQPHTSPQALGHDAAGGGRNINADPLPLELLRRYQRRAATAEGVQHDVVLVAARLDDAFEERQRLLRRIAKGFLCAWELIGLGCHPKRLNQPERPLDSSRYRL
jgi:hypothetical protein